MTLCRTSLCLLCRIKCVDFFVCLLFVCADGYVYDFCMFMHVRFLHVGFAPEELSERWKVTLVMARTLRVHGKQKAQPRAPDTPPESQGYPGGNPLVATA